MANEKDAPAIADDAGQADGSAEGQASEEKAEETPAEEQLTPREQEYKNKYEEAQKLITEKSELVARQDELLATTRDILRSGNVGVAKKSEPEIDEVEEVLAGIDWSKNIENPKEVFKEALKKNNVKLEDKIVNRIVNTYQHNLESAQSSQEIEREFYGANKDLKEHVELVDIYAAQIVNQHRSWSKEQIFKETANRVRAKIAAIRKGVDVEEVVPVEGAGGKGDGARKPKAAPKNQADAIDDYFAERNATKAKKMSGGTY